MGTAIAGGVPVIGKYLMLLARGGENVTGDTLARFYALHVVILPLTALAHHRAAPVPGAEARDEHAARRAIKKYGGEEKVPSMPFVPHFLLRDMVGWYIALGMLAALAALFPWELGQKADPSARPRRDIKPEWYFLFMFQTLKDIPAQPIPGVSWLNNELVGIAVLRVNSGWGWLAGAVAGSRRRLPVGRGGC